MKKTYKPGNSFLVSFVLTLVILWVIAFVIWIVWIYVKTVNLDFPITDPTDYGVIGDFFGGIIGGVLGSIVSILSLVLVYKTFKQQSSFLTQAQATASRQQFEATFVSLLEEQRDILKNLEGYTTSPFLRFDISTELSPYQNNINAAQGQKFMAFLHEDLGQRLSELSYELPLITKILILVNLPSLEDTDKIRLKNQRDRLQFLVAQLYKGFYNQHHAELGHYFRHFYHILKYVDDSDLNDNLKRHYADIVQAQMSNDEHYLAAINGIAQGTESKIFDLLSRYEFIENLDVRDDPLLGRLITIFYSSTENKATKHQKRNIIFVSGYDDTVIKDFVQKLRQVYSGSLVQSLDELIPPRKIKAQSLEDFQNQEFALIDKVTESFDKNKPVILAGHFLQSYEGRHNQDLPLSYAPKTFFLKARPYLAFFLTDFKDHSILKEKGFDKLLTYERIEADQAGSRGFIEVTKLRSNEWDTAENKLKTFFAEQFPGTAEPKPDSIAKHFRQVMRNISSASASRRTSLTQVIITMDAFILENLILKPEFYAPCKMTSELKEHFPIAVYEKSPVSRVTGLIIKAEYEEATTADDLWDKVQGKCPLTYDEFLKYFAVNAGSSLSASPSFQNVFYAIKILSFKRFDDDILLREYCDVDDAKQLRGCQEVHLREDGWNALNLLERMKAAS